MNDEGLDKLLIPYVTTSPKNKSTSGQQEIQLSTLVDGQQTSTSNIVFSPQDKADVVAPSSGFEKASLRFNVETDNRKYSRADLFARILRQFDASGQHYPMVLSAEPDEQVSISAELLHLSDALQVVLIDQQTGRRHDLSGADSVAFTPEAKQTKLTLAVGDDNYIDQLQQQYLPKQVEMRPNYPNPFNPSTTLKFSLPERAEVNLVVYDVLGRRVATLIDEVRKAGIHTARFDASRYASGMYFGVIEIGDRRFVEKMLLVK